MRYMLKELKIPALLFISCCYFSINLNLAHAQTLRTAVIVEELLDRHLVTSHSLMHSLQNAFKAEGFDTEQKHSFSVLSRRLRVEQLLAADIPSALTTAKVDLVVVARLQSQRKNLTTGIAVDGQLTLRLIESGSRRVLIQHQTKASGKALTLRDARTDLQKNILQKAWSSLKPVIKPLSSGKGEVLLSLKLKGMTMHTQRFLTMLQFFPEIQKIKLLSKKNTNLFIAITPTNRKELKELIKKKIGLKLDSRKALMWWATYKKDKYSALPLKLYISDTHNSALASVEKKVFSKLLRTIWRNSLMIRDSNEENGKKLHVQIKQGSIQASILGKSLSIRYDGINSLINSTWQLARQIEQTVQQKTPHFKSHPKLNILDREQTITHLDYWGIESKHGKFQSDKKYASIRFSKRIKKQPGISYKKTALSIHSKLKQMTLDTAPKTTFSNTLDEAHVETLLLNTESALNLKITNIIEIPIVIWPRFLLDLDHPQSFASLIEATDDTLSHRIAAGLRQAHRVRELKGLERGIWLPISAFSMLYAEEKTLLPSSISTRFQWSRQLGEILSEEKITPQELALSFVGLLNKLGCQAKLYYSKKPIVSINTGWLANSAGLAHIIPKKFIRDKAPNSSERTLWIPLVIDGEKDFMQAWKKGLAIYRKNKKHGRIYTSFPVDQRLIGEPNKDHGSANTMYKKIEAAAKTLNQLQQRKAKTIIESANLDKGNIKKRIRVAKKLLQIRSIERARQLLEGYLMLHEKDKQAITLLALSYAYQGAFELAQENFLKAGNRYNAALMSVLLRNDNEAIKKLRAIGQQRLVDRFGLKKENWLSRKDPQRAALGIIAGADNMRARERILGKKAGPDRRKVRLVLDLLRY